MSEKDEFQGETPALASAAEPKPILLIRKIELVPAARGSWVVNVVRSPYLPGDPEYQRDYHTDNVTERFGFTDINDMVAWLKETGGPLP